MAKRIDLDKLSMEDRAIIEARRAYKKAWRKANPEKVAESERRFYERQAAELKKRQGEN